MEPGERDPMDEIRLPFEAGDIFVQAHANGAILVVQDDYGWRLATLPDAVVSAAQVAERGGRVLLGHEDLDARTVEVLDAVRTSGATILEFGTVIPPMTWPQGTTPLMTAATDHRHDLLDDLLDRGVPAGDTDEVGATALHHAAHAGNEHAVDALLSAGLDPAAVDRHERTPADLARLGGHVALAERLATGRHAADDATPQRDVEFRGAAGRFAYEAFGVGFTSVLAVLYAAQLANVWSLLVLAFVPGMLWFGRHLLWSGGPLSVRSDTLHVLTLTGVRRIPLREVKGVIALPATGVRGAPWNLLLLQDRVGREATRARLRAPEPGLLSEADADRLVHVASRVFVVIMGRTPATDRVLRAVRPALSRPDVVANVWWHDLEGRTHMEVMARVRRGRREADE